MNYHAIRAIYRTEMTRMMRTVVQSIVAPVLSTSLYFVIFGAANILFGQSSKYFLITCFADALATAIFFGA